MKNIIKASGGIGAIAIVYATAYFIKLYVNFTQLILSLGIAGLLILAGFLYIYNWMKEREEDLKKLNKSIDLTRDYMREMEGKLK